VIREQFQKFQSTSNITINNCRNLNFYKQCAALQKIFYKQFYYTPEWVPVETEIHLQWNRAVGPENRAVLAIKTPLVFNHLNLKIILVTKKKGVRIQQ